MKKPSPDTLKAVQLLAGNPGQPNNLHYGHLYAHFTDIGKDLYGKLKKAQGLQECGFAQGQVELIDEILKVMTPQKQAVTTNAPVQRIGTTMDTSKSALQGYRRNGSP